MKSIDIDACGCRLARSTPTSRTITTTSTISSNSSNSSRRVNRRCRVLARGGPVGRGAARRWPGPEACSATTAPRASRRRDYRRPWSILSPRLTPVSKNSILPPMGAQRYFLSLQFPSLIFDRREVDGADFLLVKKDIMRNFLYSLKRG